MTDYTNLQKRCQRGEPRVADANDLLAECYGALGVLMAENSDYKGGQERYEELCEGHRSDIRSLKAENESLRSRIDQAVSSYSDLEHQHSIAQESLVKAETRNSIQCGELERIKAENEALKIQIAGGSSHA